LFIFLVFILNVISVPFGLAKLRESSHSCCKTTVSTNEGIYWQINLSMDFPIVFVFNFPTISISMKSEFNLIVLLESSVWLFIDKEIFSDFNLLFEF